MIAFGRSKWFVAAVMAATAPMSAQAAGDLLVAPTRIVLDGSRGTEIVLNNIGSEPATYRISLELRRMRPDGGLDEVTADAANAQERAALDMIRYSPRRVILPPNQPQVIRLGVGMPEGLPPGEYRAHMLFRAVPDAVAAEDRPATTTGLAVRLTPIYGVTIPVIVRNGALEAKAAIGKAWLGKDPQGRATFNFDLSRTGNRSVYGEIEVVRPGVEQPVLMVRGIAVYPEIGQRVVSLPVSDEVAAALRGTVTIRYREDREQGGATIAEASRAVG